jgi:hypothetical protein
MIEETPQFSHSLNRRLYFRKTAKDKAVSLIAGGFFKNRLVSLFS